MTLDPRPVTHDLPLLLYDAACGFCTRQVQFLLRHDKRGTLRFAPLGGVTARGVLERHPELEGVDSMVWVESGAAGERAAVRSDAALHAARHLGGLWRCATFGYIIPRHWRDTVYDLIARHRHRFGGPTCAVPGPEDAGRFLP
ncbi:MAG TPA: DCC1-like thiol-disulfide oxidoreductase family protein [Gemmatimonadales bacterium]|nr:DCC1-like thiol-disulfide oxidoreductase family protein [Gemmatimonadales bacterium]